MLQQNCDQKNSIKQYQTTYLYHSQPSNHLSSSGLSWIAKLTHVWVRQSKSWNSWQRLPLCKHLAFITMLVTLLIELIWKISTMMIKKILDLSGGAIRAHGHEIATSRPRSVGATDKVGLTDCSRWWALGWKILGEFSAHQGQTCSPVVSDAHLTCSESSPQMAEAALQAPLGEFLPAQRSLPAPSTTKDASADVLQRFHRCCVDEDVPRLAPSLLRQTLCHHVPQVEQQQSSELAVGQCKDTIMKHHCPLPKRTLDRETNLWLKKIQCPLLHPTGSKVKVPIQGFQLPRDKTYPRPI